MKWSFLAYSLKVSDQTKEQMEQWNGKKKGKNCLSNIISPKITCVHKKVGNQAYCCRFGYQLFKKKRKERTKMLGKQTFTSFIALCWHLTKPKYDTHQIIVIAVIYYFTILILSNILDTPCIYHIWEFRIDLYPFFVLSKYFPFLPLSCIKSALA